MIFSVFLLQTWIVGTRKNLLIEAGLISTHGLCFETENKNNAYLCKPQFLLYKVEFSRVFITQTCLCND